MNRVIFDVPSQRLIDIFGHAMPNHHEITAFENMIWRQSYPFHRYIRRTVRPREVSHMMDGLGFYAIFDYQIREKQIRFSNKDYLATAIIAGLNEFVEPIDR